MTVASRTGQVALEGTVVGVRRWGDGAPAVLLLHGAGGNRDSLAPLGDALAAGGLDVASVSLPGRAGSAGDGVDSIAQAAAVVAAAMAVLAPDGTVVLGHSMGGGIALELALTDPDHVRGLVLAATGARLRVHPDILARAAELVEAGESVTAIGASALRPDGPPWARSHVLTADAATPGPVALRDWQATDGFDRMDDLGEVTVPALVVAGEVDRLTPPRYAAFMADHLPSAELVVLPGAGHWLPVEEAEAVADAVAAFVRRLDGHGSRPT